MEKRTSFRRMEEQEMSNLPAGWLAEEAANYLRNAVAQVAKLEGDFMEIGSLFGRSSVTMGEPIKKLKGRLWCIDTWDMEICTALSKRLPANASYKPTWKEDNTTPFDTFKANIAGAKLKTVVRPLIGITADYISGWNRPLRLIFVDGNHEYGVVREDAQWRKFLVKDGIIAFHDYTNYTIPSVKKAIDDEMNGDAEFEFIAMAQSIKAFRRK